MCYLYYIADSVLLDRLTGMENSYNGVIGQKSRLNESLGHFNSEISSKTKNKVNRSVGQRINKMLMEYRCSIFGSESAMKGSPMFVTGNTLTMGNEASQEQFFDDEIKDINQKYDSLVAFLNVLPSDILV